MGMHDSSYKYLFSHPQMVRDLIIGFIPDAWLHGCDYSTLEKLPNEYISDDFRHRSDDIIWRVRVSGEWVYLYFLIEFQSSVDKYMALRVMVYLGLLYQDLIKHGDILPDGRLPPVLPIVLYNGDAAWTAAQDIHDLIPPVPGLVEHFKPQLKYFLIDERTHSDSELASQKNLVAAIFRFEHSAALETLPDLVGLLKDWLADQPELGKMIARWLRATLRRKTGSTMVLPEIDDLQELRVMLADRLERWGQEKVALGLQEGLQKGLQEGLQKGLQKGRREGRQEGRREGRQEEGALLLQRLLTRRFGSLPPTIQARIAAASIEEIDAWVDAFIDAPSLEAIFASQR